MTSLSTVQPDYEGILSQLRSYVNNKSSWMSLKNSSTAEMLLEAIAMVGEYDQHSIAAAVNETTFDNAHLPESIYVNSRFLGVRISRKIPAHCTCRLQNSDLSLSFIEIPPLSQFTINGIKYFNRDTIIFNSASEIVTAELYQGEIKSTTYTATGLAYQTYKLEEKDPWTISDQDILCTIGATSYARSEEPVFQFGSTDAKFYENSYPDGNVECKFGNGTYGMIPEANSQIIFKYAVTDGSLGNNTQSSLEVKCSDCPTVYGESLTNAYGGSDEEEVEFYKELGPENGASNGRAITRDDFRPIVIKFPGVLDCRVYGQAEIAPNDKNWMNVIGLLLLTDDTFTQLSFKNLVKYLKSKAIYGFQYKWFKAEKVSIDISLKINLLSNADLTECQNLVYAAIEDYMKVGVGSLGRSVYASDIEDLVLRTIPNYIDYIDKSKPLIDNVINKNQYLVLNSLTIEAGYSERDEQEWVNKLDPYNFMV